MSDVKVTIPRDDYNPNQRTDIDVQVVNGDGSVSTRTVKGAVQSITQEDGTVTFGILASAHVPFSGGATGYAAEVLADSPLFYWRLGESSGSTATDETANGRDGTYNGSPTLGVAGAISDGDTAVGGFDGSNYVTIADASWMDIASGGLTVEAWFKLSSNLTSADHIVARDSNSGGAGVTRHWALRLGSSEQINFLLWNSSTSVSLSGSTTGLNDGNWHHAVATYDGSDVRVYIDGSLDGGPTSFSGGLLDREADISVGAAYTGAVPFTEGPIDEVAVYDTALSAARIAAHYAAA